MYTQQSYILGLNVCPCLHAQFERRGHAHTRASNHELARLNFSLSHLASVQLACLCCDEALLTGHQKQALLVHLPRVHSVYCVSAPNARRNIVPPYTHARLELRRCLIATPSAVPTQMAPAPPAPPALLSPCHVWHVCRSGHAKMLKKSGWHSRLGGSHAKENLA